MEKDYSWKPGAQFPVAAAVAAKTIMQLQQILGKDTITARELLDFSRDENAPLHDCFEWDDSVAAELYRIEQARHIIGSIQVTTYTQDEPPITTRYFVNVKPVAPKSQGAYAPINVAFNNPDYRKQVLVNALGELRAFQRKYNSYDELNGVFKSIDDFADAIQ